MLGLLDIPFFAFWILLFLGREKLGLRGIAIAIGVWVVVRLIFAVMPIPPSLFVTALAVMDIVLVLIVFGGDVRIT